MYQNQGRENNNVLNPGGAPESNDGFGKSGYRPERGGYAAYGQHGASQVSAIMNPMA